MWTIVTDPFCDPNMLYDILQFNRCMQNKLFQIVSQFCELFNLQVIAYIQLTALSISQTEIAQFSKYCNNMYMIVRSLHADPKSNRPLDFCLHSLL